MLSPAADAKTNASMHLQLLFIPLLFGSKVASGVCRPGAGAAVCPQMGVVGLLLCQCFHIKTKQNKQQKPPQSEPSLMKYSYMRDCPKKDKEAPSSCKIEYLVTASKTLFDVNDNSLANCLGSGSQQFRCVKAQDGPCLPGLGSKRSWFFQHRFMYAQ